MVAGFQVQESQAPSKRKMQKIPGQLQYMPEIGAASFLYFCPILLVKNNHRFKRVGGVWNSTA